MAMGALWSLYCVLATPIKSARITVRDAMSASSIDRSGKRWKKANLHRTECRTNREDR